MSATLTSLRIRNLALVEDIFWETQPGFTAITGETGAGKSVILGALNLLLGERADKSLIRTGADSCTVEAVFDGVADPRILAALDAAGAEPCEDARLLLKRTLAVDAPGRQFVNGSPCTLALLRSLGEYLVDLHGPHDHQSLFSRDQQTRLLDSFAGAQPLREEFAAARKRWMDLVREKTTLQDDEQALLRELDLLQHQSAEIDSAALSPQEEEDLLAKHKAAANATKILQLSAQLSERLSGEDTSLLNGLAEAVRACRELAKLDPAAEPLATLADSAAETCAELDRAIQNYAGSFDADPAALSAMESRLDVIQTLKRKYGATVEEVLAFGQKASARLAELQNRSQRAGHLDADIDSAHAALLSAGKKLSAARKSAATKLEKKVTSGLQDLGFAKCGFSVTLETQPEPGPLGLELAEFVFSPNPGEAPRPLRAIASSGEISRVMLALKGALAEQDEVALLVFDEIDANVGGEIATRVAARMRDLATNRQVLCITHLPQVAASAHHQFVVSKEVRDGRTRTLLSACQNGDRKLEIARMLGGKSDSSLALAEQLLSGPHKK